MAFWETIKNLWLVLGVFLLVCGTPVGIILLLERLEIPFKRKKRDALIRTLSVNNPDDIWMERRSWIKELKKLDFELFGGCKKKRGYDFEFMQCHRCDWASCPYHGKNDDYYEQFDSGPARRKPPVAPPPPEI